VSESPLRAADPNVQDLVLRARGYAPEWHPTSRTPALAVGQVFARYMELLRARLALAPGRSQLAFLDMLGTELLSAQAARAPLVFTLIEDSPVDVTLPEHSQVAAAAPPGPPSRTETAAGQSRPNPPPLFATEQTITLARSRLAALYSIDPGRDQFADHTRSHTGAFALFDNMRLTEHALYLGHDELFALTGNITVILAFSLESSARQESDVTDVEVRHRPTPCTCSGPCRCHDSGHNGDTAERTADSKSAETPGGARGVRLEWEYLTETGWLPLISHPEDDTTGGLRHDGQFTLTRECGPNAKKASYERRESFWLRGRLTTPLPPREMTGDALPIINDIRASVKFSRKGIVPDAAFNDGIPLDPTKDFYPFGQQPAPYATFYLASKDVFSRKGAEVSLDVELSQKGIESAPVTLAWEYYDGTGWNPLSVQPAADSKSAYRFTVNSATTSTARGTISFRCPRTWAESSVEGVRNYWLRARIVSGDYGHPAHLSTPPTRTITDVSNDGTVITVDGNGGYVGGESVELTPVGGTAVDAKVAARQGTDKLVLTTAIQDPPSFRGGGRIAPKSLAGSAPLLVPHTLTPPVVSSLTLGYAYLTDPQPLDHCLATNDFVFEDHTEACRWPDRTFMPLRAVADRQPAVHLGFTRPLPAGLISMFVAVPDSAYEDEGVNEASPYLWEYRSASGWTELGVLDETMGFRLSGLIQFVGPPDAVPVRGLEGDLFRLRARLKPGERTRTHHLAGFWINAVWATHSVRIDQEPLGTSDGHPWQTFRGQRRPVLADEKLEVQEWTGRGEHWQTFVQGVQDEDLRFERDRATNEVTAVWVRWHRRQHLYDSDVFARHYTVERANGLIRFGDGKHGLIPPAGRRVVLTYGSGGGVGGNVPAGAIHELHMAVPFVMSATNPVAAKGGAEVESCDLVRTRGAQQLRHRSRAVSREDLEWTAREASPEVARARCLPLTGVAGHAQRGWATIVIVPHSLDARPWPSAELRRRVREHLASRMVAALAPHVRVRGPRYVPVGVELECVPLRATDAADVEERLRDALNAFLHPLIGGPLKDGWRFGESVHLSQIAQVVHAVEGVDYARHISLSVDGRLFDQAVSVDVNSLIAPGQHQLRLLVGVA
jgi:hypothetical protein